MNQPSMLNHVWQPYTQPQTAPPSIEIVKGSGIEITDRQGRVYWDLISSWWVNLHGHANPKIAQAISDQAKQLEQVIFAGFVHQPAIDLAEQICDLLPGPLTRVFYSDNGSTAVEVAMKMAYQYWYNQGIKKRKLYLAFEGDYHGDTFGAMSVGRSSGYYEPFADLMLPVKFIPYPETWPGDEQVEEKEEKALAHLKQLLEQHAHETAALIIEPLIQCAKGMRFCRPEYIQAVVEQVRAYDILVIFDEVALGFGRTGEMFVCNKLNITPDFVCLSKGITGGFMPLSATITTDKVYQTFLSDSYATAFSHGHSYAGNPLGCAAGLASLKIFKDENTLSKIQQIESIHRTELKRLSENNPVVTCVRVMGDIAAFNVNVNQSAYQSAVSIQLRQAFLAQGLLIRPIGDVVYLMPPYCITEAQLYETYEKINRVLAAL